MASLQSYLTPLPSFGGAEYLNRQQWGAMPRSGDMRVLDETYRRSKAAHDLLMNAQADEAEQDNQILNTATPAELANLFGTPRTPREARLQKIVQNDVTAKDRGVRLIGTPQERMAYAQSQANLQRTQLANYLDPLQFQLEQSKFAEAQNKNVHDWYNQQQQRIFQNKQLSATEKYRQMQALNAEANRQQRGEFQQQNYGQRERFHDDSMAHFQSEADRKYYQDVAAAAHAGALSPTQVTQMFQRRFDPATMAMLRGYAQQYATENPGSTADKDPGFFAKMGQAFGFGTTPATTPTPVDGGDSGYFDYSTDEDSFEGSGMGGSGDFTAPSSIPYRPAQRSPAQSGGTFRPGQVIRNVQTNQMVQVMPNGQFKQIGAPVYGPPRPQAARPMSTPVGPREPLHVTFSDGGPSTSDYSTMPALRLAGLAPRSLDAEVPAPGYDAARRFLAGEVPTQAPSTVSSNGSYYGPPRPRPTLPPEQVDPSMIDSSRFSEDFGPAWEAVNAPFSYLSNLALKIPALENYYGLQRRY